MLDQARTKRTNRLVLMALIMLGVILATQWVFKRLGDNMDVAAAGSTQSGTAVSPRQEVGQARPGQAPSSRGGGPAAVEVTQPERILLRDTAQVVGTVKASQSVMLRPEASGKITAIGFTDGGYVKKGQLLFQLDDVIPRASLAQAQAQLAVAKANYQRNRELVAQGFISQAALDQHHASLQIAQGQYALAQAQIARLRVVAPFAGKVGIRKVHLGDYVREGADLLSLEDTSSLNVDFRVPERLQAKVRAGQTVVLNLDARQPGTKEPILGAKREFLARVSAIEPSVSEAERALLVRAALVEAAPELRPGMFVRLALVLADKPDALVVPEEAVVIQQGKQVVWTVVQDGEFTDKEGKRKPKMVARAKPVLLGLRSGAKVEVLQGLEEGERIVVAGWQRLQRDGAAVQVVARSGTQRSEEPAGSKAAAR